MTIKELYELARKYGCENEDLVISTDPETGIEYLGTVFGDSGHSISLTEFSVEVEKCEGRD